MTADRSGLPLTPTCPKCESAQTIKTWERFDEQLFFCPTCEHTWSAFSTLKRPPSTGSKR